MNASKDRPVKENGKVKNYLLKKESLASIVFCSEDGISLGINGLIVDEENLVTVATDGHFMIIAPINKNIEPPDWQKVIPTKEAPIRMAFDPRLLAKLLDYWIKNVNKEDIIIEFYPKEKDKYTTEMLRATDLEKRVVALLAARRFDGRMVGEKSEGIDPAPEVDA